MPGLIRIHPGKAIKVVQPKIKVIAGLLKPADLVIQAIRQTRLQTHIDLARDQRDHTQVPDVLIRPEEKVLLVQGHILLQAALIVPQVQMGELIVNYIKITTMFNRIFFISAILLNLILVKAQTDADALRFSQNFPVGTSRSSAFANASTALGADITNTYTNPAGIGLYRSSEALLSTSFLGINNSADYLNNEGHRKLASVIRLVLERCLAEQQECGI